MAKWTKRLVPLLLIAFSVASGFLTPVYADDDSQALVSQGRQLFFANGDMTVDGLLASRDLFAQAIDKDATDQEAQAFFAITHALSFLFEPGTTGAIDTLGELLEAFGAEQISDNFNDTPIFSDFPEHDGKYDPPEGLIDGSELSAFLSGPFLTRMDEVIAALEVVGNDFLNTIQASETGGDPIHIDQADIQILRAAAYKMRCWALVVTAYNLDFNIEDMVQLINDDTLQIQRDLLNAYPGLLQRVPTGAANLVDARDALLAMIDDYSAAHGYMAERIHAFSDWRTLNMFTVENLEELNDLAQQVNQLAEIQESLDENRPATFTRYKETWYLTDAHGESIMVELERDARWTLMRGTWINIGSCAFLGCRGKVQDLRLDGDAVTLLLDIADGCDGQATLSGTLAGDTISGGSYGGTNCTGPITGDFSGTRSNQNDSTDVVECNALFGNTGKTPLDIRSAIPKFDIDNKPVINTFPGVPILNGAFPGPNPQLATNEDATRMFNLVEKDTDGDGIPDSQDLFPTDPNEWTDNDGDGVGDNADPDDDNDGHADVQDAFPFNPSEWDDTDGDGVGDNTDKDDDGDGMPDLWEQQFGLDHLINDAHDDEDNDGFSNKREYLQNTDPTDPVSRPSTAMPWLPLLLNN